METSSSTRMVMNTARDKRHRTAKSERLSDVLTSLVSLKEVLEADSRLEASAFGVEARKAVLLLQQSGLALAALCGPQGMCAVPDKPRRLRRVYVSPEYGIPFLSSSDIISVRPDIVHYLSRKLTPKSEQLLVKRWDIMVSRSGTIGNIALAGTRFEGCALSEDAIRIRANDPELAGYITAFLRSRYGRPQLVQATYGSVVVHIEPHHLTRLLVPDLHSIRRIAIGKLMMEACELRDEANALIDRADKILHERLSLPPLEAKRTEDTHSIVSAIRARDLDGRIDATYHDPTVLHSLDCINVSHWEVVPLKDIRIAKNIIDVTKFRKRVYVHTGGIPMLSSKQLFQVDPIDVKRLAKGAHAKDLPEIRLDKNMIIVTRSGTIGRVQIIPAYMEDWTANQHAMRIKVVEDFNPGYLYAWLASDYGQALIRRHSYGSVILEIDKEMLGSIPVPLPETTIIEEIGNPVLKANELRDLAWRKEREAIGEIEDLIGGKVKTQIGIGPNSENAEDLGMQPISEPLSPKDERDKEIVLARFQEIEDDPECLVSGKELEQILNELMS